MFFETFFPLKIIFELGKLENYAREKIEFLGERIFLNY
jgi:hypothetical protein